MIQPTHVLLIAADRQARALVTQAIDAAGHTRLTVAESPGEARTLLNAHRYGLVIASNLGISPWLSIDVIPIDRTYEAMFISGHWDEDILRECEVRGLHRVRVPCDFDVLRQEIARVLSQVRQPAARRPDQWESRVVGTGRPPASTDRTQDVGPEVLDCLFGAMNIDAQWSIREPRAFSWWGHRLVQRVWAEPARLSHDHHIVRVHATTALLRDVPDTPELRLRLAMTNSLTSLSALILKPSTNQILLYSAAYFHAENFPWLKHLFLAAVGLQVAEAHIKADSLAKTLGGEPDVSAHPQSGPRHDPDDILNVIASTFAPEGAGPSPWTESDFRATQNMAPRPWVFATSDATGLTAEFPFLSDRPAPLAGRAETALLTVSATDRHSQLGGGLMVRLRLPLNFAQRDCAEAVCTLNSLEVSDETHTHALGAWCLGPAAPGRPDTRSPAFVSFIPAVVYRKGLLDALALAMAVRAKWAAAHLASPPLSSEPSPVANAARPARVAPAQAPRVPLDIVLASALGAIALILAFLTQPGPIDAVRAGILICVLAVLSLIDLRTGIVPDRITLPFLLIGLVTSPASQHPGVHGALAGAVVGGGVILIITTVSRGSMGGGVLKMAAMIGAFLGWHLTVVALVLSFIGGGAIAWAFMRFGRRRSEDSIEFAPSLAIAAAISLLAGESIIRWYVSR